ncbi:MULTISPECIES: inositol-3-phosphate synthase [unclassified Novosphingobium]|uniref:inositol-3-phosphate synthase n=1 Tax=unclassified Novosphingobium TaxID=2644732 RepID=UPI00146DCFB0|nr:MULTISPECIES: inositol-3-phosphate synthase [unclassified Novosphingobium]NMN07179.1 myo-inositol-1-phosphate synthase [Novosphingobium sp. SG919]NMN89233.1 myo-inositol-1-phosphate synthase [Novosphingobium sp. SG916]
MPSIKVAVIGVGNCASSLVQGVFYYKNNNSSQGLIHDVIGDYVPGDVEFVLGIDVDARKVGKDLGEAIFAAPNNTTVFYKDVPTIGTKVMRGRVLDGVADHMTVAGERGFIVAEGEDPSQADIVAALKASGAEILLNFLPVGSQKASEFYMECALEAGVAVVNCIPVFIASNPEWEARFRAAGLPIVGDDIKAQVGATIVHRTLSTLFSARGVTTERTYQLNTGGNTDFLNMLDRHRLSSKKESKTEAVQAMLAQRLAEENILIGPSEYVPWQKDNKICFLRMEGVQWGNVPVNLELRLSVEDSPNAAACVMDAIRCCKVALERGEGGALIGPSAYFCKHPPQQFIDDVALRMVDEYIAAVPQAAE